ncbi:MAG: hypothetical protein RLZZ322_987 [Verrucomicrobiota bacterium]|jgi:hypothetical protein
MRLLLALLLFPALLCAEGTQAWYQNTIWLRLDEKWSVGNDLHLRADDGVGRIHTWIASPRVRYDLSPTWQLQANVSVLEAYNADETAILDWTRFEFEVNPTFRLSDSLTLSFRDRFEWRWRHGGDYSTRIRLRPQLDWTLRKEGLFRGLYANNEVFYDFTQDRVTENRLTPLGVLLRPNDHLDLRLFYLWRSTRGGQGWRNYHGLGVQAALNY